MADAAATAAYLTAIRAVGLSCTFERPSGVSPNVVKTTAVCTAIVRQMAPDSGGRSSYQGGSLGGVLQQDRTVIVSAADLASAGFPTPVQPRDRIIVSATGETLTVLRADPYARSFGGAIEIAASSLA